MRGQDILLQEGMEDVQHLANVIYHEARGESVEGQVAVGQVVMNRVKSGRFGGTVREVVYQPRQFSGIRQYRVPEKFLRIAEGILGGKYSNLVGKSLYFNSIRRKGCVYRIGHHCFF